MTEWEKFQILQKKKEHSIARGLVDKMEKILSPQDFGLFIARCAKNGAKWKDIYEVKKQKGRKPWKLSR